MELEGFTSGAELGVQKGHFSALTLTAWKKCKKYYMVDVWQQQNNYIDAANQANHDSNYREAMANTRKWRDVVHPLRMFTSQAAAHIPNASLDYVYVDARHDFCGAYADLNAYWPKLKPNGILAGHDYLDAHEVRQQTPDQDWSVCSDGTVNEGAVKGAVNLFATERGLTVTLLSYYNDTWPSFGIRKPCWAHHS